MNYRSKHYQTKQNSYKFNSNPEKSRDEKKLKNYRRKSKIIRKGMNFISMFKNLHDCYCSHLGIDNFIEK